MATQARQAVLWEQSYRIEDLAETVQELAYHCIQRQRGKWVLRHSGYDPATGRRRVKQLGTYATKRAAVSQQRALVEGRAGTDTEALSDFLEVWLRSKEGRVALSTFDQYVWAVQRHVVPLLGAVRLCDLLRWDDVDMGRQHLDVVQQLALERGRPVLKELKTEHSERLVTFGAATAALLAAVRWHWGESLHPDRGPIHLEPRA